MLRPGARPPRSRMSGPRNPRRDVGRLTEASSSSVWPAPVFESHDNVKGWKQVGADGTAAVGSDCPYEAHGPADSLATCQSACAGDGSCNVINFNPVIPDCVFRVCSDPMNPQLSPAPNYTVWGTQRPTYGLNPAKFTFQATAFSNDVLASAFTRYKVMFFIYGNGTAASGGPLIPGVRVNVTTAVGTQGADTDESYTLLAPDPAAAGWATITAPTVFGALRGLETMSQLVQFNFTDSTYFMSFANITDYPRFNFRAVMLDTARHFLTIESMKEAVNAMSYLKLNVLHLHLTDDDAFPLVVPALPRLALTGAYSNYSHTFTPAQLADLVAYARLRGVRVIPEFDTPAHFSSLLNAYPEYMAAAVDQNNNSFLCLVDPSREEVFTFLATIWASIASTFPDAEVHIGGDEFWSGCWSQSPSVSAWMTANNYTVTDAYYYYERRMIGIARSLNRSAIAWQDIAGYNGSAPGTLDVALEVWSGTFGGDWQADVASLTATGAPVVVSGPFYITQLNGASAGWPYHTWQSMYAVDLWNFTGASNASVRALVRGGELDAWGDAAQTDSGDLIVRLSPYMQAVAEAWWSPRNATSGVAPDEQRMHVHRCRMAARGVRSHPIYYFSSYCLPEFAVALPAWETDAQ